MADIVEHVFLIAIGVWVTLVGHRVVRMHPKPGGDYERWLDEHGRWLRWGGPLIILINSIMLLAYELGARP